MTAYRTVDVDGVEVFYREAGDPAAPTLLLLHGFPASSTQYQELIDRLSDRFHLVAPDYPGFGYTEPLDGTTTFDRLADILDSFVHALELDHYGLYLFDFGAPVGFRLATRHPERVDALIIQNGNAYEAGIGPNLAGLAPYWEDPVAAEPAARTFLQLDATRAQYVEGVADPESLDPDLWTLDSTSSTSHDAIRSCSTCSTTTRVMSRCTRRGRRTCASTSPRRWSSGAPMTGTSSPTALSRTWPTCRTQSFIYSTPATSRSRPMRTKSPT